MKKRKSAAKRYVRGKRNRNKGTLPLILVIGLILFAACIFPVRAGNGGVDEKDGEVSGTGEVQKLAEQAGDLAVSSEEVRGVWISYGDFEPLGLSQKTEEEYRANTVKFLQDVKAYGVNTIYYHARAFDDASWKSATFNASAYLVDKKKAAKKAAEVYEYDPLGVFLEETHKQGMTFHAWLNPYRISTNYFYDPAELSSQNRILTAVDELLAYDIDGIHFDDYFYHAAKGYCTVEAPKTYYSIVAKEGQDYACDDYKVVSAKNKRKYVNEIVTAVHKKTSEKGKLFGISPQGNYDNDMASGADIDTWLTDTNNEYIDYVVPQIYWSNQWGSDGKTTMYSDRLDLFLGKRTNNIKFYVGLALYKTGQGAEGDTIGWTGKDTNLVEQIKELQTKKADGYVYFSAQDFYDSHAEKELANIKEYIGGTSTEETVNDANQSTASSKTSTSSKTTAKKTIKITSVKAKRGKKKITGKVSVKKATVKIKVGSAKYKKATLSGKKFSLICKTKLKKKTKITIKATKKNYKKGTKKVTVK